MPSDILGFHHVTLVCADAQRTIDFYTGVLGLRLVKKTVNFDDPASYHLYFGDEHGRPGTLVTFFEWPRAPKGHPGIGGTLSLAFRVASEEALNQWQQRLNRLGLAAESLPGLDSHRTLQFRDPDGVRLEITARPIEADARPEAPGQLQAAGVISPEMALTRGIDQLTAISSNLERTHSFYNGLLGLRRVESAPQIAGEHTTLWTWEAGSGESGARIAYLEHPPGSQPRARIGIGQTHHFALAVADEESQLGWREKILRAGIMVTPVLNRVYFKSIYLRDPDGHIVELATAGPGFAVDEELGRLGERLQLPPWLEPARPELERSLRPVHASPRKTSA